MPNDNSRKNRNSNINSNLFNYDEDALNREWSFDLDHSFISNEIENNKSDIVEEEEKSTIIVNRQLYQELVATCDTLKAQMKDLEGIIERKTQEDEEKQKKMEEESDILKREYNELVQKLERTEQDASETIDGLQMKMKELEEECEFHKGEVKKLTIKYKDMKTRGLQMLEQRDVDIKKMQKEMSEQKKKFDDQTGKLNSLESAVNLEKEKRRKFEEEVKTADKLIRDALREEKISRKQVEKKCLIQKTEKIALQEKVKEMRHGRGIVIRKDCPVTEHDLLAQRIDVLQRQRDILVDSINQRDSHHK